MRSQAHPQGSGFDDRPVGLFHQLVGCGAIVIAALFVVLVIWICLLALTGAQPYHPGLRP